MNRNCTRLRNPNELKCHLLSAQINNEPHVTVGCIQALRGTGVLGYDMKSNPLSYIVRMSTLPNVTNLSYL